MSTDQLTISEVLRSAERQIEAITGHKVRLELKKARHEATEVDEVFDCLFMIGSIQFGVTKTQLLGRRRFHNYQDAKRALILLAKERLPFVTTVEMACRFGRLDHTSIIHHLQTGAALLEAKDEAFTAKYNAAKAMLEEFNQRPLQPITGTF